MLLQALWISRQLRQDASCLQQAGMDPQRIRLLFQKAESFEAQGEVLLRPFPRKRWNSFPTYFWN